MKYAAKQMLKRINEVMANEETSKNEKIGSLDILEEQLCNSAVMTDEEKTELSVILNKFYGDLTDVNEITVSNIHDLARLNLKTYDHDCTIMANINDEFKKGKTITVLNLNTGGEKPVKNENGVYLGILVNMEMEDMA